MTEPAPSVRLAAIQQPPVFLNLPASIDRAIGHIQAAADQGVQVAGFAECWVPGYPVWLDFAPAAALWDQPGAKALYRLLGENAVVQGDAHLQRLQKTADDTGVHIVIGTHEKAGGTLYNTSFYFSPGAADYAWHRKLTPTYTERLVWGMGDGSTLATVGTDFGRLGGLICWEHWIPLARAAMHAKDETVHVAQWPVVKDIHQVASRHYAFEGRCFVIAAGSIMTKGDILDGFQSLEGTAPEAEDLLLSIPGQAASLVHNGGSAIIGPDGDYLAEPVFDTATTVIADARLAAIAEGQLTLDTSGHYARPDVFELNVDTRPRPGVTFGDDPEA